MLYTFFWLHGYPIVAGVLEKTDLFMTILDRETSISTDGSGPKNCNADVPPHFPQTPLYPGYPLTCPLYFLLITEWAQPVRRCHIVPRVEDASITVSDCLPRAFLSFLKSSGCLNYPMRYPPPS